jgi:predicted dehydrogenase
MPPIQLNRRRFLGCSAAVGFALAGGKVEGASDKPVKLGVVGLGNRGTNLLRAAMELPHAEIVALADSEPRHLNRGAGIVEKAKGGRPETTGQVDAILARTDLDALIVALPCDLHADVYEQTIRAGKHLYAEKPLGLTIAECDRLIDESARRAELTVHLGFQRRSNPRYRDAVELVRRGELGSLIEMRASWVSSNGPVNGHNGWLSRRERSGDWMMEQAVHVWDVLHWVAGGPPVRAFGHGRRDLFAAQQPQRDVTDHYTTTLEWADGFHATLVHSWVDPADDAFTGVTQRLIGSAGGLDLTAGTATFREKGRSRLTLHPGNPPQDTKLALQTFLDSVRSREPLAPPITLAEARAATLTGLLVRKAVDERRVVTLDEIVSGPPSLA